MSGAISILIFQNAPVHTRQWTNFVLGQSVRMSSVCIVDSWMEHRAGLHSYTYSFFGTKAFRIAYLGEGLFFRTQARCCWKQKSLDVRVA